MRVALCAFFVVGAIGGCGDAVGRRQPTAALSSDEGDVNAAESTVLLEHDFGIVHIGDKLSHRFVVKNDSDDRWIVGVVKTGCKCTLVDSSSSKLIEAKTEGFFNVSYTVPNDPGPDRRVLVVQFAEPVGFEIRLAVRANVGTRATLSRTSLISEAIVPQRQATPATKVEEVLLDVGANIDIKSLQMESTQPWLAAEYLERDKNSLGGNLFVVRCILSPTGLPYCEHKAHLQIYGIGDESGPRLNLAGLDVHLIVKAAIEAVPSRVSFGSMAVGQSITKTVVIRDNRADCDSIPRDISCSHTLGSQLVTEWTSSPKGAVLKCTLQPEKSGYIRGTITINGPRAEDFTEIPVYSNVSSVASELEQ